MDLIGQRFGNWIVIDGKTSKVLCECQCDKRVQKIILRQDLVKGKTKSCGCQKLQRQTETVRDKFGVDNVSQSEEMKSKKVATCLENHGVRCSLQSPIVRKKSKETMMRTIGAENPMQSELIKAKVANTNLERYGYKCSLLSSVVKEKTQATNLFRFGCTNPFLSPEIQEKARMTKLERYGHVSPYHEQDIREKSRQTNLLLYGYECPFERDDVSNKSKKSLMERYGFENPFADPIIRQKISKTNLERYGFENPMHNPNLQAKAWQTRLENPNHGYSSEAEREILEWVRQFYPESHPSHTGKHQVDILIPSIPLAIEYNGLWWHCDGCQTPRDRKYHIQKYNEILEKKQARTIFIWEHEWRDRKEQVKNLLLAAMKQSTVKVGARKCEFKEIPVSSGNAFIDDVHIQGSNRRSSYAIGCFYDERLVAVATFGRHHRNGEDVVLNRFACLSGYHISGALSKISKMAVTHFKQDLISWADKMKSDGSGYEKSGWTKEEEVSPDYFYISRRDTGCPISKQSRRKSVVKTPDGMTEAEHAKQDGLSRVWDCGKIRYRYKFTS